jgi:hypothetical protein
MIFSIQSYDRSNAAGVCNRTGGGGGKLADGRRGVDGLLVGTAMVVSRRVDVSS